MLALFRGYLAALFLTQCGDFLSSGMWRAFSSVKVEMQYGYWLLYFCGYASRALPAPFPFSFFLSALTKYTAFKIKIITHWLIQTDLLLCSLKTNHNFRRLYKNLILESIFFSFFENFILRDSFNIHSFAFHILVETLFFFFTILKTFMFYNDVLWYYKVGFLAFVDHDKVYWQIITISINFRLFFR